MYLSAVVNKLSRSGLDWPNGFTLQYYMIQDGLRWGNPLGMWLGQHHILVLVLQWFTLLFQATFVLAVLFPKLRWIYVPIGLGFHSGIYLTMRAPFFRVDSALRGLYALGGRLQGGARSAFCARGGQCPGKGKDRLKAPGRCYRPRSP
jgi:hypothetical protein